MAYPMKSKSSAGQGLKQFMADCGVPNKIICDGSAAETGKDAEFANLVRKHQIDLHRTEPSRHNQSKVEGVIWELQK